MSKGFVSIICLLGGAAIISMVVWMIQMSQTPEPLPRWEYQIRSVPDTGFDAQMNQYGAEGWELVFARRASDGDRYDPEYSYEMIFKRVKLSVSPEP